MATVKLGGITIVLIATDGADAPLQASEIKQDLLPTAMQAVQGIPGDTDVLVGSEIVDADFSGAVGLFDQKMAPGDRTRSFLSEADTTRPRQTTSWIGSPSAIAFNGGNLSAAPDNGTALVDTGNYGVVTKSAAGTYDLYQWNGLAFIKVRTGYTQPALPILSGYTSRATYGTYKAPNQVVVDYAGGLWMSANDGVHSGLVDISVPAALPVGDVFSVMTCAYFDLLLSFGITQNGVTVIPYRFANGSTPATAGSQLQHWDMNPGSGTFGTAVNTVLTIPGEKAINGVVASEGAVYLVTDRRVYAISWNDQLNTLASNLLPIPLPRFTSPPVAWQGSVWIGAGNQIVQIVPGQRTYNDVLVDDMGMMPAPFNGRITQLVATPTHLVAQVIEDNNSTPLLTAIMIRDSDGAWAVRANLNNAFSGRFPLLQKVDANGIAVIALNSAADFLILPMLDAGKNPRNLSTSVRGQFGIQRIITPWEVGSNESALKQLLRHRLQVLGVGALGAATHVRSYVQFDNDDTLYSDAIYVGGASIVLPNWTGIAKGLGLCYLVQDAYQSAIGDYGSAIPSGGAGFLWTEFDGSAAVGNLVGSFSGVGTSITPFGVGSGYGSTPTVAVTSFGLLSGSGATATATVAGGAVTGYTLTANGAGYPNSAGAALALVSGGKTYAGNPSGSPFSTLNRVGAIFPASNYPSFRRFRRVYEIGGDTSGTLVPTLVAAVWQYFEYPSKSFQFSIRGRIRREDTQLPAGTYPDGPSVAAAVVSLEALASAKSVVAYQSVSGATVNVLITKITEDTLSADANGPEEVEVQMTLQVVPLQGPA